ncbi:MAG: 16S rRNA (uracil(1498)-N(3))-methyltransferase [Oscillospiraceae bacterium]|nr:16S rRNA (uracil(1498)-N(3))-methyltransferase [Oscillospiraceae bacterium]MBQ4311637.1 16S rRNA (uracil(1498)-N(3))-methyltransferase [Oscillospiraceae bacterium]
MPRFFIEQKSLRGHGSIIVIEGADARHIGYSLRMKPGDKLIFCRDGTEYDSTITKISETMVVCDVNKSYPTESEPSIKLTLCQALPKSDKMEQIIQKSTELGAYRIVPFMSERCVIRPNRQGAERKLERYNRIAEEAAKQSGRGIIPEVAPIMSFEDMLAGISSDIRLICYENGGISISEAGIDDKKSVTVIVGAEGGFEQREVDKAKDAGCVPIWLGKRILRCETCPVAVTAVIMNLSGNL